MKTINRRDFIKLAGGGIIALVVGRQLQSLLANPAYAAVQSLELRITDAMKQMVTHNTSNDARCYLWIYKSVVPSLAAECPGPTIFCAQGDTIQLKVTNDLDESHSFFIPGVFNSGPILPGQTINTSFTVPSTKSGAFLYYDNLNEPVNRVMGLHGAFIIMPAAKTGAKWTPYHNPTTHVQEIFDAFGNPAVYPGLAWEQGDAATGVIPFRTYIWLQQQASPNLFAEVGNHPPGVDYPAQQFIDKFLKDPFSPTNANGLPQYFTVNGQSGHFSHAYPHCTPHCRVGEPCVVHILNAGLWTHSKHVHANHFYITSINGVVQANPIWVDVYSIRPMDVVDYVFPYMRPPDVPNQRGIGRPDTPLTSLAGRPVWPPVDELGLFLPPVGTLAAPIAGSIGISVQLSPLCYPGHDHSEPTQTSQGGNYNLGLITGMNFTGDRNINPSAVTTFPNSPSYYPANTTGLAGGPETY